MAKGWSSGAVLCAEGILCFDNAAFMLKVKVFLSFVLALPFFFFVELEPSPDRFAGNHEVSYGIIRSELNIYLDRPYLKQPVQDIVRRLPYLVGSWFSGIVSS